MKGVILSASFFIMSFAIFLGLGFYVNYEHNRSLINNNFKKSLINTAKILQSEDEVNEDDVLNVLITELEDSLPTNFTYHFELMGFYDEPILIRVRLKCESKSANYKFELEETVIEKEFDDES